MPDRSLATASRPPDLDAMARRARVEARASMPPWVAIALLAACLLAVNMAASLFRATGDAVEEAPGLRRDPPAVAVQDVPPDPG